MKIENAFPLTHVYVFTSRTPLMYASLIGLKDAVFTLLQHGANPLLRDTNGHRGILSTKSYKGVLQNVFGVDLQKVVNEFY